MVRCANAIFYRSMLLDETQNCWEYLAKQNCFGLKMSRGQSIRKIIN